MCSHLGVLEEEEPPQVNAVYDCHMMVALLSKLLHAGLDMRYLASLVGDRLEREERQQGAPNTGTGATGSHHDSSIEAQSTRKGSGEPRNHNHQGRGGRGENGREEKGNGGSYAGVMNGVGHGNEAGGGGKGPKGNKGAGNKGNRGKGNHSRHNGGGKGHHRSHSASGFKG